MPVYQLDQELWFPPSREYENHGVVAIGGDISVQRLLLAYKMGIFPWYNEDDPITWWCPDKRMVLKPKEVKISKSMRSILRKGNHSVTLDQSFEDVLVNCQKIKRKNQDGTWLNNELITSLIELHELGYAHSVECWEEDELVGGLYGISLGRMFFGESMFSKVSNSSKIAFISLCQKLESLHFDLIDCQIHNDHLASLGAYEISRTDFLDRIENLDLSDTLLGKWNNL